MTRVLRPLAMFTLLILVLLAGAVYVGDVVAAGLAPLTVALGR